MVPNLQEVLADRRRCRQNFIRTVNVGIYNQRYYKIKDSMNFQAADLLSS